VVAAGEEEAVEAGEVAEVEEAGAEAVVGAAEAVVGAAEVAVVGEAWRERTSR
jgi:hypothetical protein